MTKKKEPKLKTFKLSGDILHAGTICVKARTPAEARAKVKTGDFTVFDEMDSCLGFIWDGNDLEEME